MTIYLYRIFPRVAPRSPKKADHNLVNPVSGLRINNGSVVEGVGGTPDQRFRATQSKDAGGPFKGGCPADPNNPDSAFSRGSGQAADRVLSGGTFGDV